MITMQDEGQVLKKISLDEPNKLDESKENSVLIPKIDVVPTAVNGVPPAVPEKKTGFPKFAKMKKPLLAFGVFLAVFLLYTIFAGFILYRSGAKLANSLTKLQAVAATQDVTNIKREIVNTKSSLAGFSNSYKLIAWAKFLPFIGPYVGDVGHGIKAGQAGLEAGEIVLITIEPYADLLGFKVDGGVLGVAESGEKTTQERIDFIVKTIPDILPKIDQISDKVKIVQEEITKINPDRYPEKYKDREVRSKIKEIRNLVSEAATFIVNGKPVLENAPYLLGMDSPRTYFLLFQNDKELRPTGGFMTGYAIMKVDKAKFEPVASDDIYNLDARYKPSIKAPEPIVKYIKGPYILSQNLRLRDMNWSPDFTVSMEDFVGAIGEAGVKDIDGIIAVDTQLLENLLDVIGPIGVPGFGNFSTAIDPECNCPQVIHELESFADIEGPVIWDPLTGKIIQRPPNSDNRKRIIGPLMNSILANALGQPKEKLPALFSAGFTSLIEKHVLFYVLDDKIQPTLSEFGIAGRIKEYEGDYLHINDANLGGRKSNLYATEEVEQDIEVERDGTVTKTVSITYKNPEKHDGWLNSVLPTWVRVYVPKGSELIASEGLEAKSEPYEDLGKTVFAGFFQLRPEGVSKVTFKYKLPFKVKDEYNLLIQKQPGTDGFLYTIRLGRFEEEFFLKVDKELKIEI